MIKKFEELYTLNHIDYVETGKKIFNEQDWVYQTVDSGTMVFTGVGSPLSQAVSIGYENTKPETIIKKLEEFYFTKKCDINFELDHVFNSRFESMLMRQGFNIVEEGSVYIKDADLFDLSDTPGEEITIVDEWDQSDAASTITRGFTEGVDNANLDYVFNIYLNMENNKHYYTVINNQIVGGGFIYCHNNWGMLCGASTLPDFRRRGVQTKLIKARVKFAVERGVNTICVITENNSASEKSMLKMGFVKLTERKKYHKSFSK